MNSCHSIDEMLRRIDHIRITPLRRPLLNKDCRQDPSTNEEYTPAFRLWGIGLL